MICNKEQSIRLEFHHFTHGPSVLVISVSRYFYSYCRCNLACDAFGIFSVSTASIIALTIERRNEQLWNKLT
jgi:hypothetical protein